MDSVEHSVDESIRRSVFESIWYPVRISVRNTTRHSIWESVENPVWDGSLLWNTTNLIQTPLQETLNEYKFKK